MESGIENRESWNKFVIANSSPASFLQSWEWGDFQQALGHEIYRLKIKDSIQAQLIVKKLPLGRSYLEIPKGPVFDLLSISPMRRGKEIGGSWNELIKELREIGKKEQAVLVRINPPYPHLVFQPPSPNGRGNKGEGVWRKPEILIHQTEPEDTVLVNLSKSEDELTQNMHEKSRYNLRLAERKGVKVRLATQDQTAFEIFLELLEETTKRDGITSWPHERFWKFRERFMSPLPQSLPQGEGEGPKAELLIGELDGKILAAAIVMLFGDASTYLYAASSAKNRPANVSSLVLWEAIKLAKARGKKWYDMWGIAPANAPDTHPWAGITRFKSRYVKVGVTGKEMRNIGARDLVFDQKHYLLFKIGKKFSF